MTVKELILRIDTNTKIYVSLENFEFSEIWSFSGKVQDLPYSRVQEIEEKQVIKIEMLSKLGEPAIHIIYERKKE